MQNAPGHGRWPEQLFDVFLAPARLVMEADLFVFAHHGPEVRRLHLARAFSPCLERRLVHAFHA